MLSLKEKTAAIRKELKNQGITSKQVSVRGKDVLYDESISITIKDLTVKKSLVEEITNKYESIRYDQYNGEVLQGCNTFVNVSFDYNALADAKDALLEAAEKIIQDNAELKGTGSAETVFKNGNIEVIYAPLEGHNALINLYKRATRTTPDGEQYTSLEPIVRYAAYNKHIIAEALAIFKYQYDFHSIT